MSTENEDDGPRDDPRKLADKIAYSAASGPKLDRDADTTKTDTDDPRELAKRVPRW